MLGLTFPERMVGDGFVPSEEIMRYHRRNMVEARDSEVRPKHVCTPKYALKKARTGIRLSRWELEGIAGDPTHAFQYALHVAKGRWPQGEPSIMRGPYSVRYAAEVIGGRWEEAEPVIILKGGMMCVEYAKLVVKGRWVEAEAAICRDHHAAARYHRDVVRGPWEELERTVAGFISSPRSSPWRGAFVKPVEAIKEYMKVVKDRAPLLEAALVESSRAGCLYRYARGIGGRLPGELHQKMMMFSFMDRKRVWSRRYVKYLDLCARRAEHWIAGLDPEARRELFGRFQGGS